MDQEKTNQMMGNVGQKAQEAKEKTKGAAQAAKDKTEQAAQAAKDKTQQAAQSAKEKAQVKSGETKEKASEMGESTKESAQYGKDNTSGFLQQTGVKVKEMAHGATEAVKQTFGMAPQSDEEKDYYPTQHRREY